MSSSLGFPHLDFTSVETAQRDTLPHRCAELYCGEHTAEGPAGTALASPPPASSALSQFGPSSGTYTLSQPTSVPCSCLVGKLNSEAENLQCERGESEAEMRQTDLRFPLRHLHISPEAKAATHCVGRQSQGKSRGHAQWPRRNNTERKCMWPGCHTSGRSLRT